MWNHISMDVLSHIFSFLPPHSLACASSSCNHWRSCAAAAVPSQEEKDTLAAPPWLLAFPLRADVPICYAYNPELRRWHMLNLDFLPCPVRPVSSLGSLLLCKLLPCGGGHPLRLALCNPFTRQYRALPEMQTPRSNPAVGVVGTSDCFQVYVAGGMSASGTYETTVEVYDGGRWEVAAEMPSGMAVRLTVWTPERGVYAEGRLYWMTSARVYDVVEFDLRRREWREVSMPMAEQLEWAVLVQRRRGRVALLGGGRGVGGCIWELEESGEEWRVVGVVEEVKGKGWGCVGGDGVVYVFRDLCSKMLVWRRKKEVVERGEEERWEWGCLEGRNGGGGGGGDRVHIRAALINPSLSSSHLVIRCIDA